MLLHLGYFGPASHLRPLGNQFKHILYVNTPNQQSEKWTKDGLGSLAVQDALHFNLSSVNIKVKWGWESGSEQSGSGAEKFFNVHWECENEKNSLFFWPTWFKTAPFTFKGYNNYGHLTMASINDFVSLILFTFFLLNQCCTIQISLTCGVLTWPPVSSPSPLFSTVACMNM